MVVDRLTKYAHFLSLAHPYTAETVAEVFMEHVYKLHGLPGVLYLIETKSLPAGFGKLYSNICKLN